MDPAPGLAAAAAGGSKSEAPSTPALHGLPVEMTTGEMEAAIAALPAKKEALREAFDVLAACSPFPVPFVWADLDSYISSLQSSIDRRFGQLRVLEAARPALAGPAAAATSDGKKGGKQEEDSDKDEEEEEEEEEIEEEVEEEEEIEEEEIEEEEEEEVREEVDEEQQGADEEMQKSKDADEASKNTIPMRDQEEQEAEKETIEVKDEEQHGDKPASQEHDIGQDEDEEAEGEQQVAEDETMEAKLEEQNEAKATSMEQDIEEEEGKKAKKASLEQGNRALPSCGNHLRGVCAGMDVRGLLNLVCKNQSMCLWHEYPVVMRHAPDAAALVLQVVQGFLVSKKIKTSKVWGNCVGLIRCLPALNASLSADTMKQAKQLAKDWKEMIDKPGSSGDVLNLSSWGLLYFVISYNIVSEFSVDEIFCIFGTLSRKQQKKNGIELCKGLGLVDRITDLIDYLIGNGQQLEALLLTQAFNLIDKYTPLSLLKGYVERAKQNALDIINMNSPRKSLSPTITKEVGSLMVAQNIVQQQIADFNVRSGMLAEIKKLLDQYATKRSSGDACAVSTSNSQQQQQKHTNKKRKREQLEQQQHRGQEIQEQKQQIKLQGKKEQPQTKPEQKKQQQQNTNKPQEQQQQQQHQKQQIKPQGKMGKEQTKPEEQQQQQKTKRPQEQQQKQPQKKQQQQQQQQQSKSQEKRPRPRTTKLPISSIPASISPMVPHIVQVDSFGHSPYAAMPGSHTYAAQLGWSGIQSAAFAQNVGVSQFMGLFNPQQPNYPFYRHPPFYPR